MKEVDRDMEAVAIGTRLVKQKRQQNGRTKQARLSAKSNLSGHTQTTHQMGTYSLRSKFPYGTDKQKEGKEKMMKEGDESLGATGSPYLPARWESPHSPQPKSPDFWAPLKTTLEPTSTSLKKILPCTGMLEHLVQASRALGPRQMSSLY